jgi:hypothetical protein
MSLSVLMELATETVSATRFLSELARGVIGTILAAFNLAHCCD